jgi:hypothetical protein
MPHECGQCGRRLVTQCSATVSNSTDGSSASTACRCGGTATRSPGPSSAWDWSERSTTRPRRHSSDPSPGLLCLPITRWGASATTVCRSRAPVLAYTVTELRPLRAAMAVASRSSATALIDATFIDVDGGMRPVGGLKLWGSPGMQQARFDRCRSTDRAIGGRVFRLRGGAGRRHVRETVRSSVQ